jgi:hypothetical protein
VKGKFESNCFSLVTTNMSTVPTFLSQFTESPVEIGWVLVDVIIFMRGEHYHGGFQIDKKKVYVICARPCGDDCKE